jgi:hypothetical protein
MKLEKHDTDFERLDIALKNPDMKLKEIDIIFALFE